MDAKVQNLIIRLISHLLETADEKIIHKNIVLAQAQINAPLRSLKPRQISFWWKKWKKEINPKYKDKLEITCNSFSKEPASIFSVLNLLKKTKNDSFISKHMDIKKDEPTIKTATVISEEELISDIFILLQGGQGNRIIIQSDKIKIDGALSSTHSHLVGQILKAAFCLDIMNDVSNNLCGIIGQAIAQKLQKERRDFILQLATLRESKSSLLSLYAYICGTKYEKLSACAWISNLILQSKNESLFNILSVSQNHGNPIVRNIGQDLMNSCIDVYLDFIKEWVVYGFLEDPYDEFFIAKNPKKVKSWDWWNSKYIIVPSRIPINFVDKATINKIVSCGRAWNFIRKYRNAFTGVETESHFSGKKFEMKFIDQYSKQSMKNVMIVIQDYVWISGHLKTLNDFILFFRGDFSSSLFRLLTSDRKSETLNVLIETLRAITSGTSYTNSKTKEKLIDRIDFQMKSRIDQSSIKLTYRVDSPLDSIFDPESLNNYYTISQLIWKLKCSEFYLSSNWKRSRRPNSDFIDGYDRISRLQNIIRHSMLTTVRAINEFISTDVIHSSCQHFNQYLSKANDFDDLLKQHREHVNSMMRNTLLTNEYINLQGALARLLEIISNFNQFENEFENAYDAILESLMGNDDFQTYFDDDPEETPEDKFTRILRFIKKSSKKLKYIGIEFNNRLNELYQLTSENSSSIELQRLELRLLLCKNSNS